VSTQSNVIVRLSEESDAPFLQRWLMDPVILRWFPLENAREVEDAVRICMSYLEIGSAYTACVDGEPCGMAVLYLHRYKKLKHQSLFVIIVDERYRGQGIGTKIFERLKKEAKEKFSLEILHLEVYAGNPAKNLYDRLGFVEYGRQERFLKEKGGVYRDKINMQLYL
jgi:RimJ/RimL family protein N-acetyltransferase